MEMYIFQAKREEVSHNQYPWIHIAEHEYEYQQILASKIVCTKKDKIQMMLNALDLQGESVFWAKHMFPV